MSQNSQETKQRRPNPERRSEQRPRIGGDFVAADTKAKSLMAELTVFSRLADPVCQLWARYFALRSTSVGFGPGRTARTGIPARGRFHDAHYVRTNARTPRAECSGSWRGLHAPVGPPSVAVSPRQLDVESGWVGVRLEGGNRTFPQATVARRLSVLRGTYRQLAAKGLVSWETAQDIGAVKAPEVQKNSTPSHTQRQGSRSWRRFRAIPCKGFATWR
jgi:hypothetical protein